MLFYAKINTISYTPYTQYFEFEIGLSFNYYTAYYGSEQFMSVVEFIYI